MESPLFTRSAKSILPAFTQPHIKVRNVTPFLKWAGGKRWLVKNHSYLMETPYLRYVEPFLGSGAVFFHLAPEKSLLSDSNFRLIETYQAIKDDWISVYENLKAHARQHSDEYYYRERSAKRRTPTARAAQFIYLNRACWNGLYRVNLKGDFNVPRGTKNTILLPSDNWTEISSRLKAATILAQDFEETVQGCKKGDFIFADPPYTIKHNSNGFIKYNEAIFTWADQIRLRDALISAVTRGAIALVTNANHDSIRSLYRNLGVIKKLNRNSIIAASSKHRVASSELGILLSPQHDL